MISWQVRGFHHSTSCMTSCRGKRAKRMRYHTKTRFVRHLTTPAVMEMPLCHSAGGYETGDTLDMLFDEQVGLLSTELPILQKTPISASAYCDIPDLSFSDLDLPDIFGIGLLNEEFLPEHGDMGAQTSCDTLTVDTPIDVVSFDEPKYTSVLICETDHQYSRSPLESTIDVSCDELIQSASETNFGSPSSGSCDRLSVGSSGASSPLGGDIENMQMTDIMMEAISSSDILQDEDFICNLTDDTDVTMGMDIDGSQTDTDDVKSLTSSPDDYQTDSLYSLPFTVQDCKSPDDDTTEVTNLSLSDEEKSLLLKQGIVLPSNMPLTKQEEKALRAVRRKIRNKVSAKESRKRKQTYVEGLEKRIKACTSQNFHLQKKVDTLEKQNITLMSQLKKIQALITSSTSKPAGPRTCLMVMLLSFALFVAPNFNLLNNGNQVTLPTEAGDEQTQMPTAGRSRSLLHTTDMTDVSFDKIVSSAKELLGDDVSIDAVDLMKVADKYQESDVGKAFSPSMDVITKQLVDIVNETETVIKREERKMAIATRGRKVKIPPTDDIYDAVTPVKEKVKVVVKVADIRKKDDL
ncbi:hypothetical protein NP493_102g01048 [Ridgeia piscesae]|uniref:BZIP domain-containing protein n=1 Tax=Ridgeia piscesae TaxID=27915 RepID=A0AAD9P7G6_RIDPI|nr:hypothetical protein NP493_102g01048 [Ridgeia piscesae]